MEKDIWQRLARYLADEMPVDEATDLQSEIAQNPEHKDHLKEAQTIWKLSAGQEKEIDWASEKEWQRLQNTIENNNNINALRWYRRYYWQAAAAVLIVVGIVYLANRLNTSSPDQGGITHNQNKENIYTHMLTTTDSVKVFYLPDSSRVWLNQRSALSYTAGFGKTERRVTLEGEGFFEVKRAMQQPFIVSALSTETRVLGTTFNLKAYQADALVELRVVSGKVSFGNPDDDQPEIVVLPRQKASFHRQKGLFSQSVSNDKGFLKWMRHNNAVYNVEVRLPRQFIKQTYTWKKNGINQTVIEGKLTNTATITAYKNIKFTYRLFTRKGVQKTQRSFTVSKRLLPGQTIAYKHNLLDIFTSTARVIVDVQDADAVAEDTLPK